MYATVSFGSLRTLKGTMTYYVCEIGEAGNECFRQETLLPLILLSSSPVLLSLVFITACSV